MVIPICETGWEINRVCGISIDAKIRYLRAPESHSPLGRVGLAGKLVVTYAPFWSRSGQALCSHIKQTCGIVFDGCLVDYSCRTSANMAAEYLIGIRMGGMSENPRARKLADRIKEIVASMLDTKIKDPRLGFVTITDVRVTGDLQNASIFYTVLGDETAHTRTAAALESCKGLLRSEVGKQTGVRLTPTLEFHLDSVPETAQQITDALTEAQRRDAELDALRVGKQYAGDADPYRKPALAETERELDHEEPLA